MVSLIARQSVYEADEPMHSVLFPMSGVLALVKMLRGGETVAVAHIGKEGFTGHAVFLGGAR